ncbi:MAG: DUF5678 domain-containing protein [Proteobacteria bacterium]|nr:DUF5678 domain-containing protein [Pseudomonadota bacterium]
MNCLILVNNPEKYSGKYVAKKSFKNKNVVCSGKNLTKVYESAKRKGIKDPVVFFVPLKGMVQVY